MTVRSQEAQIDQEREELWLSQRSAVYTLFTSERLHKLDGREFSGTTRLSDPIFSSWRPISFASTASARSLSDGTRTSPTGGSNLPIRSVETSRADPTELQPQISARNSLFAAGYVWCAGAGIQPTSSLSDNFLLEALTRSCLSQFTRTLFFLNRRSLT